jgi:hypothetical protein
VAATATVEVQADTKDTRSAPRASTRALPADTAGLAPIQAAR